jgi:ADP-heptose:LPS heptosyltransferase
MLTPTPELFANNPHVHAVHPLNVDRFHSLARLGVRVLRPDYRVPSSDPDRDIPPVRHLIADMCATAGLTGRIALKPELFFRSDEVSPIIPATVSARPLIAIMSGGAAAAIPMRNKDWPVERWQRVVELGRERCDFIQLGSARDATLAGARDLRGRTTLRETALILKSSSAFVGQVGLLMHLARAVDCPAVIVFGGRERPDQSGYACNENLYSPVACSPCWRRNGCEHDRMCLATITPGLVWTAIERCLARPRAPLALEEVTL